MPYSFDTNERIQTNIDIARGHFEQMRPIHLFGFNRLVGITYESLFNDGGGIYPFPGSAGTITAVSSSTDTMGVYIEGLDANYHPINETITLTGTTPKIGSKSFFRINKARITTGSNAGNITLTIGGLTVGYIEAGTGIHQAAVYTTPADSKLFINRVSFSSGTVNNNKYLTGRATIHTSGGPVLKFWNSTWFTGFIQFDVSIPFIVPPKTDIQFDVKSSSGENEVACYINAFLKTDGWLVDLINREWE